MQTEAEEQDETAQVRFQELVFANSPERWNEMFGQDATEKELDWITPDSSEFKEMLDELKATGMVT